MTTSTKDPRDCRSVADLLASIAAGGRATYLMFWGHQPRRDGTLGPMCLSQWWPAPFKADGLRFATAEHYMMWSKARLFGDDDAAQAVLQAPGPAQAKKIGRLVKGFEEDAWVAHRWQIVVDASVGKFGSDPALRAYLLGTSRRVLVEASPRDRIWGIGMGASNEHAQDPARWRGLNLLGFALMEARQRLGAQAPDGAPPEGPGPGRP